MSLKAVYGTRFGWELLALCYAYFELGSVVVDVLQTSSWPAEWGCIGTKVKDAVHAYLPVPLLPDACGLRSNWLCRKIIKLPAKERAFAKTDPCLQPLSIHRSHEELISPDTTDFITLHGPTTSSTPEMSVCQPVLFCVQVLNLAQQSDLVCAQMRDCPKTIWTGAMQDVCTSVILNWHAIISTQLD